MATADAMQAFVDEASATEWMNLFPLPGFMSWLADVETPFCQSPPFSVLAATQPKGVALGEWLELESGNLKQQAHWNTLTQLNFPVQILCRPPSNERMKLALFQTKVADKLAVMGLLTPFQEDVAMTQAHHDFVSIMSHEFRTPLTSIRGFADTMLHYGSKLDATQQQRFIRIIRDQADRLSRMVENVLTISRLGQETTLPKPRPLVLRKVIDKVEGALQGKGVDCATRFKYSNISETLSVWAEPDSLEQVILNLMDNAVKYSPATKPIIIEAARCANEPDRYLKIMISDQGNGMTEEQRLRLFRRFYRTSNHMTQEVEGSGLGLYITKTLVQRMGGAIGVRTEEGKGSTFWFTVPLNSIENQNTYRNTITMGTQADDDGGKNASENIDTPDSSEGSAS